MVLATRGGLWPWDERGLPAVAFGTSRAVGLPRSRPKNRTRHASTDGYFPRMTATFDILAGQAMVLPPAQRLNLARTLIESVDGTEDSSPEAAWDAEIRARLDKYLSRESPSVPAADVFRRLREIAPGR